MDTIASGEAAAPAVYGLDIETDTTVDGLDPAVGRHPGRRRRHARRPGGLRRRRRALGCSTGSTGTSAPSSPAWSSRGTVPSSTCRTCRTGLASWASRSRCGSRSTPPSSCTDRRCPATPAPTERRGVPTATSMPTGSTAPTSYRPCASRARSSRWPGPAGCGRSRSTRRGSTGSIPLELAAYVASDAACTRELVGAALGQRPRARSIACPPACPGQLRGRRHAGPAAGPSRPLRPAPLRSPADSRARRRSETLR